MAQCEPGFRDVLNVFVFVYLDNILIFSPSLQVHLLEPFRELFVKAEKCNFIQSL